MVFDEIPKQLMHSNKPILWNYEQPNQNMLPNAWID